MLSVTNNGNSSFGPKQLEGGVKSEGIKLKLLNQ